MHSKDYILGIDTSNYTTSLAITDKNGDTVIDSRKPLLVKQGERGLRQSSALFQHMENIPLMLSELFNQVDKSKIAGVAVSKRPRPIEGSYMPVFLGGVNYGKVIAEALGVPLFAFSHQEGHLEAIKYHSPLDQCEQFLAYHLSGGTSELLKVSIKEKSYEKIEIIGGSKDISFGQVIDRVGVAMGLPFPAGKALDEKVMESENERSKITKKGGILTPIKLQDLYINLSGIETQSQRNINHPELIFELFVKIAECLCKLTEKAAAQTGVHCIIFAGGVSSSQFIRNYIERYFQGKDLILIFGNPKLASDNAVGISLLGGKALWQ